MKRNKEGREEGQRWRRGREREKLEKSIQESNEMEEEGKRERKGTEKKESNEKEEI